MSRLIRIGIIGIGKWGKKLVNEFLPISEIKMVCSTGSTDNIKWIKKKIPNVEYTNDVNKILKNPNIDAVIIASPVNTHFKLAYNALLNGKHVFVEKPISDNLQNAKKLLNLAIKKNLVFFVGHVFLFHPILKKIKSLVKKNTIKFMYFQWEKFGTFSEDIILNLVSHEISIILELIDKPIKIKIINKFGLISNLDILSLKVSSNKEKNCIIEINRLSNTKKKQVFIGTKKDLFLWENNELYKLNKKTGQYKLVYNSNITPLSIECKEFILSMKKKKIDYSNPSNAIKILSLLKKIRRC